MNLSSECKECGVSYSPQNTISPLLLSPCGHHMCHSCVSTPTASKVKCPVCRISLAVLPNIPVTQQFPVDFHLLGRLAYGQAQLISPLAVPEPSFNSTSNSYDWKSDVCQEHGRKLEFVSREGMVAGCPKCFLVGHLKDDQIEELNEADKLLRHNGVVEQMIRQGEHILDNIGERGKLASNYGMLNMVETIQSVSDHLNKCRVELELSASRIIRQLNQVNVGSDKDIRSLELVVKAGRSLLDQKDDDCSYSCVQVVRELKRLTENVSLFQSGMKMKVNIDQSIIDRLRNCVSVIIPDQSCHVPSHPYTDFIGLPETDGLPTLANNSVGPLPNFDLVKMTFIEDPSSFYVVRVEDSDVLRSWDKELKVLWREEIAGQNIETGNMAILCGSKYYRTRVESVEGDVVSVFLMDTGERRSVSSQELVVLSGSLATRPDLAHHCGLSDTSCTSKKWDKLVIQIMMEYIGDTPCRMIVRRRTEDILFVSLRRQQAVGVTGERVCSMEEYLEYKGVARLKLELVKIDHYLPSIKHYLPSIPLESGLTIVVSHVDSPHQLYVQRGGCFANSLLNLNDDLTREYSIRWVNDPDLRLLVPVLGSVCVARYSGDGKIYRAEVVKLLDRGIVEIQYIDYGNREEKKCEDLRKLLSKFLIQSSMSFPCQLADVDPSSTTGWTQETATQLMEMTQQKKLSLHVVSDLPDSPCQVLLYEVLPDRDILLNAWLVDKNLAVSHSGMSIKVEYIKPNNNKISFGAEKITPSKSLPTEKFTNKITTMSETVTNIDLNLPESDHLYQVLDAISPARIHMLELDQVETFHNFSAELSAFYESESSGKLPCEVPPALNSCWVTKLPERGWVRVRLLNCRETELELFLLDFGRRALVSPDCQFRSLDQRFGRRQFCTTVHLTGVLPAGGSNKWTRAACEELSNLLESSDHVVSVEAMGEPVELPPGLQSWPAKISLKEVTTLGPMDPEVISRVQLSDKLKEAGLAIPARIIASDKILDILSTSLVDELLHKDQLISSTISTTNSSQSSSTSASKWCDPLPPTQSEFNCTCTYVDWDCRLYVSNISNRETINHIQRVLNAKYIGSSPRPSDLYWTVGEDCVAKYHLDGKWYRARVTHVYPEQKTCKTQFIDFGNVDDCSFRDMRKDLFTQDLPIQCFTIKMEGVEPLDGISWKKTELDFLHESLVEQELKMKLRLGGNFPLSAIGILTKSGLDIRKMLIKDGFARETSK